MSTHTSAAVRDLEGVTLPAAGAWTVDPGHAEVGFIGRHFMLTKVRGRFTGVDAATRGTTTAPRSKPTEIDRSGGT